MEKDKHLRLLWKGVFAVIGASFLVGLLFGHFGRFDLAGPTLFSIIVIVYAIAMKWELRRHVWFWAAMVSIAALHVPLILYTPWTTRWISALVIAPILAADFVVILAIIKLLERQFEKATPRVS